MQYGPRRRDRNTPVRKENDSATSRDELWVEINAVTAVLSAQNTRRIADKYVIPLIVKDIALSVGHPVLNWAVVTQHWINALQGRCTVQVVITSIVMGLAAYILVLLLNDFAV